MGDLTAVEAELAAASTEGRTLDLSRRVERVVRAEVIRDLVRRPNTDVLGVGLRGARVVGELDLELVRSACPLLLDDCVFDERPAMFGAEIPALSLDGSTLPGLYAEGLRTNYFTMTNARLSGTLDLDDARVDGQLRLLRTSLRTGDAVALQADGLRVGRDLWLNDVLAESTGTNGAVLLNGCDIGGSLVLNRSVVTCTRGNAVEIDGATVADSVIARSAFVRAENGVAVRMIGAQIGGQLVLDDTVIRAGATAVCADGVHVRASMHLQAGFDAASARDCTVRVVGAELGDLVVSDAVIRSDSDQTVVLSKTRVRGGIHLRDSCLVGNTFEAAVDIGDTDIGSQLVLSGTEIVNRGPGNDLDLFYSRIGRSFLFPVDELTRKNDFTVSLNGLTYPETPIGDGDWLRLLSEHVPDYEAQAYQQLAKVHRAAGHEQLARKILIAQQNDLRRRGDLGGWWARRWHWFLGRTLGYGYQPSRAVIGLVATFAASVALVIAASWTGGTTPAKDRPETACTLVNRVSLAADLAIPLVKLGGQARCEFSSTTNGQWYTAGGWVIQLLGWSFATLSVAGFTGLVRKN